MRTRACRRAGREAATSVSLFTGIRISGFTPPTARPQETRGYEARRPCYPSASLVRPSCMDKPDPKVTDALRHDLEASWHRFLDLYEPLRPELYRYCRHLARSRWDADDLVQDALFRAFAKLGCMNEPPTNPRAWLFGTRRLADPARLDGLDPAFFRNVLPQVPRVEPRLHRGEWLLVHWYAHNDGEAVRAITRVEAHDDRLTRVRNYFYTPDVL